MSTMLVPTASKVLATAARGRRRSERGAITAEYAVTLVAACGFSGILIALLKSDAMMAVLKAIINWALSSAGVEGVQV
jgi:Protein of unknown function (DUF4244)